MVAMNGGMGDGDDLSEEIALNHKEMGLFTKQSGD